MCRSIRYLRREGIQLATVDLVGDFQQTGDPQTGSDQVGDYKRDPEKHLRVTDCKLCGAHGVVVETHDHGNEAWRVITRSCPSCNGARVVCVLCGKPLSSCDCPASALDSLESKNHEGDDVTEALAEFVRAEACKAITKMIEDGKIDISTYIQDEMFEVDVLPHLQRSAEQDSGRFDRILKGSGHYSALVATVRRIEDDPLWSKIQGVMREREHESVIVYASLALSLVCLAAVAGWSAWLSFFAR